MDNPSNLILLLAALLFVLAGFSVGRDKRLLLEWWAFAVVVIWLLVGKF